MLKGISPILSPELLKIIAEMGHGDELVIADGNFPGSSIGKRCGCWRIGTVDKEFVKIIEVNRFDLLGERFALFGVQLVPEC